jgi:hypothetical protein
MSRAIALAMAGGFVGLGMLYRVLSRIAHTLGRMERLLRDKFEPGWNEPDEDASMR